jgi:hypothetical protein
MSSARPRRRHRRRQRPNRARQNARHPQDHLGLVAHRPSCRDRPRPHRRAPASTDEVAGCPHGLPTCERLTLPQPVGLGDATALEDRTVAEALEHEHAAAAPRRGRRRWSPRKSTLPRTRHASAGSKAANAGRSRPDAASWSSSAAPAPGECSCKNPARVSARCWRTDSTSATRAGLPRTSSADSAPPTPSAPTPPGAPTRSQTSNEACSNASACIRRRSHPRRSQRPDLRRTRPSASYSTADISAHPSLRSPPHPDRSDCLKTLVKSAPALSGDETLAQPAVLAPGRLRVSPLERLCPRRLPTARVRRLRRPLAPEAEVPPLRMAAALQSTTQRRDQPYNDERDDGQSEDPDKRNSHQIDLIVRRTPPLHAVAAPVFLHSRAASHGCPAISQRWPGP